MTCRDRAGFFRTSRGGMTPDMAKKSPLFCFSPRPLSALDCSLHSCQSTSLSSAPAFLLPPVASPSYCLPTLLRSPTRLLRRGLEGLCRNIATIGLTPLPPAAGSSLGRASVMAQGMGEGLSLKFAVQAIGKWVFCLSRLLIVANARGLRGGFGGMPLPWNAHISLEVTTKRERGRSGGINKFKINNCWLTRVYCRSNGGGQEDHRRQNTSKGNEGEYHWHCYLHHRLSVREDDG